MAFVMPHCACNSSSDNHLAACHIVSYITCFTKRHSLSLSEFTGSWAPSSLHKHNLLNALPVGRVAMARVTETHTPTGDTQALVDPELSSTMEGVQASSYVLALMDIHDFKSEYISEADLLRLQRARLAKLELSLFNFDEEEVDHRHNKDGSSSCTPIEVPHCCRRAKTSIDPKYKRQGEIVAVRSMRRKERSVKRERANLKARKAAVTTLEDTLHTRPRQVKVPPLQCVSPDRIRSFLVSNGSGTAKLLTAAEEVSLAYNIQDLVILNSAKKGLQKQLGREPTLAEWADSMHMSLGAFSSRLIEDQCSKNTMIQCNLRLVISVARKYEGRGLSIEDLVQEGSQGLIRGCEKFDPKKGCKFSTYAHWWIMQAITKALLQKSRFIRMPSHASDTLLTIRRAKDDLQTKYGHFPSHLIISKYTGISLERLRVLANASKHCRSFDKPVGKDMNMNLAEMIADSSFHPSECKFMQSLLKEDVDTVLRTLKPRERDVMRLRYGLDDGKPRTLAEIGRLFHVTRERIRQIERQAMLKLKEPERMEAFRSMLSEC